MGDVESDDVVKLSEMEELTNKVSRMNKNLITIMNTVKNIEYQLTSKNEENKENDKERINKAFEKKQIGRPVGSWEDKRNQYFEWIKSGKITQPKEDTLAYYKINKDPTNNSYVLLSKFHTINIDL